MIRWRRDPAPASPETYDSVLVVEIALRWPQDGKSGGEFRYVRYLDGVKVDAVPRHAALETGEPDTLESLGWEDWLRGCLAKRGLLPEAAERDARPLPLDAPPAPQASGDLIHGLGA